MSDVEIPVALTIGDRVVARATFTREGLAHVAALIGLGAVTGAAPIFTAGVDGKLSPKDLVDGSGVTRRALETAILRGELRGVKVKIGYRVELEDLRVWEARPRARRGRPPSPANDTGGPPSAPTAPNDDDLLASAGRRAAASGGRR